MSSLIALAATIPVLQRLARDPDRRVRLCVAQNAHTTFLILAELEQDPDPAVSWAALKGLTPR